MATRVQAMLVLSTRKRKRATLKKQWAQKSRYKSGFLHKRQRVSEQPSCAQGPDQTVLKPTKPVNLALVRLPLLQHHRGSYQRYR